MAVVGTLVLIFVLSLVLIKAADGVILSIRHLAQETGTKVFVIAAVFLALATSLPELFVGLSSAFSQESTLSLGDVVGANIANLSLIVGLAGVIAGRVEVKKDEFLKKELPFTLLAGILPVALLWDRELSRVDGLVLIAVYVIYAFGMFRRQYQERGQLHEHYFTWSRVFKDVETGQKHMRFELVRFVVSITVLLVSAGFVVKLAIGLANLIGVPVFFVGLLVISLGTTLPELAFSLESVRKKQSSLLLGNVLGSVVANATLILGVVLLIYPVAVPHRREYLVATITFLLVIFLFWLFSRTKHRLDRWESAILLIIYLVFVSVEVSGFKPVDFLFP